MNCVSARSCTASNIPYTAQTAQAYSLQKVVPVCFRVCGSVWGLWLSFGALGLNVLWSATVNILNSTNYCRNNFILRVNTKHSFYNKGCC